MEPKNKTRADAYARVSLARLGCFVGASDAYLLSLHAFVCGWADDIARELQRRAAKADEDRKAA